MTPLELLLRALGAEAELVVVGGSVRDRCLGRPLGDVDLATRLMPPDVMARAKAARLRVLPTGLQHGTVMVRVADEGYEITTYRGDGDYADGRRPTSVQFGVTLEEDLARRDFTINAMAVPLEAWLEPDWRTHVQDPFGGQRDLEAGLIRAVGDPLQRFQEDGLRALRACRFASTLDFALEGTTQAAIAKRLEVARRVAVERVLVELTKLLCGSAPARGLALLEATGLMDLWMPELRPMVGCTQNEHHAWPVWEHALAVVVATPSEAVLRWAALLHDVGKPETRSVGEDGRVHFYDHERRSEAHALTILKRLKASKAFQSQVVALVRHHGQYPNHAWRDAALRRLLARLVEDDVDLEAWGALRAADLIGKGHGRVRELDEHEAAMTRLRHIRDDAPPMGVKDLVLDGRALLAIANRPPGPWLGQLQRELLQQVVDSPDLNEPAHLEAHVRAWLARHA